MGLKGKLQFINHQPPERIPDFMAASDALLVHLKQSELSKYIIPTKTLSYLAAGKPIILALDGAAAQLVNDARAGLVIPPERPSELASAIRRLGDMSPSQHNEMGRSGREYVMAHLTKQKVIPKYEAILKRAIMTHLKA
jgi:glycosyltransferase involved in cell wall biosynthesis